MHLFNLSPKQAVILLPLLLSSPIKTLASDFERRGNTPLCCIGSCPDDDSGNEEPDLDGPTSDQSAGIGVEFEAGRVQLQPRGPCSQPDINRSKGALIDNRQGPNWMLTGDTTVDLALVAEYILNGKEIKIGSGDAATAAAAVANDIVSPNHTSQYLPSLIVLLRRLHGIHQPISLTM